MKIFISADIEGVAGVVTTLQGQPGNPEYERARRLMTEEVNAAIAGAFDGGATEVVVNDSHGPMINLLPDLLDPRADLILGRPKPASMCAGLDASFNAVMFTGYHAGAGRHGILSHTVNGFAYHAIRVNGIDCAEATLYGAYAGSLGIPVIMLSGDDQLRTQVSPLFPAAEFAVVKTALAQRAARALSPANAHALIHAAATKAVGNIGTCKPYVIPGPYTLELDLSSVALADLAADIPVSTRIAPRTVAFPAESMRGVIGWISAVGAMSASLR